VIKKRCFKCEEEKSTVDFYAHAAMGDGLLGKCKACTKADVAAHRKANHATVCAYDRARSKLPERKTKVGEYQRRSRLVSREKCLARQKVGRAVASGRLVPTPCVHCGDVNVQGHHRDYSKPLDVVWCCFKCHREIEHGGVVETDQGAPHFVAKRAAA